MNFLWLTVSTVILAGLYLACLYAYSIWSTALGWAQFSEEGEQ